MKRSKQNLAALVASMERFLDSNMFLNPILGDAFKISMLKENYASFIWQVDDEVFSEDFDNWDFALDEAFEFLSKYPMGLCAVIPDGWHLIHQCDWIWIDLDDEGKNCWACTGADGETALFRTMEQMFDEFLDYEDKDWTLEAQRVLEFLKHLIEFAE